MNGQGADEEVEDRLDDAGLEERFLVSLVNVELNNQVVGHNSLSIANLENNWPGQRNEQFDCWWVIS